MSGLPHFPARGILLGCCGAFLYTLQDAAFKWMSGDYAVAQIIFLRSFLTLLIAVVWLRFSRDARPLRMGNPTLFFFSLVAHISAWFCFYTGLKSLPLTLTICIFFLVPVVIALLSIPILGEKPTWRQSIALIFGFIGVLIITNPFAHDDAIDLTAVAWILASVLLWAFVAVTTRALQPTMTVSGTLFYTTIGFLLVSGIMQPFVWRAPTAGDWLGMILLGGISAAAQCCLWAAYRMARSAVVAIAEYSALLWAALLGWLLWDEQQGWRDIIGVACIIGAGILVLITHRRQESAHL